MRTTPGAAIPIAANLGAAVLTGDSCAHYRISRHDRMRTPTCPMPLLKSSGSPNASTFAPGAGGPEVEMLIDDERRGRAAGHGLRDRCSRCCRSCRCRSSRSRAAGVGQRVQVRAEVGARRGRGFGRRRVEHDVAGDRWRCRRPLAGGQTAGVRTPWRDRARTSWSAPAAG